MVCHEPKAHHERKHSSHYCAATNLQLLIRENLSASISSNQAAAVTDHRQVESPAQVLDCLVVEDDTIVAHDAVVAVRVVGVQCNISVDLYASSTGSVPDTRKWLVLVQDSICGRGSQTSALASEPQAHKGARRAQ